MDEQRRAAGCIGRRLPRAFRDGLLMADLQIYDPRERRIVAAADRVLAIGAGVARLWPRRAPASPPRRILLLRLERIGDLLMSAATIRRSRGS